MDLTPEHLSILFKPGTRVSINPDRVEDLCRGNSYYEDVYKGKYGNEFIVMDKTYYSFLSDNILLLRTLNGKQLFTVKCDGLRIPVLSNASLLDDITSQD